MQRPVKIGKETRSVECDQVSAELFSGLSEMELSRSAITSSPAMQVTHDEILEILLFAGLGRGFTKL
jgi:hypothetical protein